VEGAMDKPGDSLDQLFVKTSVGKINEIIPV